MALTGEQALAAAKKYTRETAEGMGAVKGQDGFSPIITENENNTDSDYRLDITTAFASFTTDNLKGAKGDKGNIGDKGDKGDKGEDGISPTISENADNNSDTYKLDISNADGSVITTPNLKGADGSGTGASTWSEISDKPFDTVDSATLSTENGVLKVVGGGSGGGGEANVQSDWNETDTTSDAYIKNKPTIPTKVSELENDSGYVSSIPEEYVTETELAEKGYLTEHQDLSPYAKAADVVAKETGKSLVSDTDIVQITTNKNAIETLNGTGEGSIDKRVADEISKVVANAPEDFDTLKEVSDWIANDTSGAAKMQNDIATLNGDETKEGSVQKQIKDSLVVMTGATSTADGASGLVPKPIEGDENKFLKGDGTWGEVVSQNVTVDEAMSDTSNNPVQNKAIKKYVDDIAPTIGENGNWFVLDKDTGVKAQGENGEPGQPGVKGTDGVSPTITEDAQNTDDVYKLKIVSANGTIITPNLKGGFVEYGNAGFHNSVYRGKFLGTSVTAAQYAAISAGTFDDLYIGDYWTISGVNWRIAAFDYYLNCGDTATTAHHAVIVPDTALYNYVMNDTNVTTGGYVGSKMYKQGLTQAKTTIKAAFSGHVLKHRVYLVNAVSNGAPSAGAWCDSEVELMNEQMVYGGAIFMPIGNGNSVFQNYRVEKSQLPLFALEPSRIAIKAHWWLRDVVSASRFARVGGDGLADYGNASNPFGVRPAFSIS